MEKGESPNREIVLATGNAHKIEEIRTILSGLPCDFRTAADFPAAPEPEETGDTYDENAAIKARAWRDRTGLWSLADDSGLEVDALGGRPGIHSSRYASTSPLRIEKLLAELQSVPSEKRTARFVCVVVLCGPNGEEFSSRGMLEGRIAQSPSGTAGFGYDPVFQPEGLENMRLAEIGPREKNRISHRARALQKMKPVLEKILKGA